jgi:hypothetical protein
MRWYLALVACISLPVSLAHADDKLACHQAAATDKLTVTFKPDTSVQDLAVWVAGFSCKSIVFAADVPKHVTRVTIVAPKPMTPKQAMELFVSAIEATGLTVTEKADTITIKLGSSFPRGCPDLAQAPSTPATPATPATPTTPDPDEAALQAALDKGIKKIDDTHYELKRDLVDTALANPMAMSKGARVVPAMKDGKVEGFKLYAIRPSSVYARLGFTNGDTLQKINGMSLESADKALEVYTKLRDATKLDVEIVRRGKPLTISITIVK